MFLLNLTHTKSLEEQKLAALTRKKTKSWRSHYIILSSYFGFKTFSMVCSFSDLKIPPTPQKHILRWYCMLGIHFQLKRKVQASAEVLATDMERLTMVEIAGWNLVRFLEMG